MDIQTQPIELSQKAQLEKIRGECGNELSANTFNSLYLWQHQMKLSVYITDCFFAVKCGERGENAWFFPCGNEQMVEKFIRDGMKAKDFSLCYIGEKDANWLNEKFPSCWKLSREEESDEYICNISELIALTGGKYKGVRHKISRIERENVIKALPITDETADDALAVVSEWEQLPHHIGNNHIEDIGVSDRAISERKQLGIEGTVVYIDDQPVSVFAGFPIGENIGDALVGKCRHDAPRGFVYYAIREYFKQIADNYTYCNLEEDLGIPGIRLIKEELRPERKKPYLDSGACMKKDYFVSKMFYKMLIPSVISSVGYAFSDMADALVVGQRMGETGLAAISLCLPIYMLMNVIMHALGMGGAVRFSALLGVGNEKEAKNCFNNIFKVSLLSGVVFALLANLFAPQILAALGAGKEGTALYSACETYMRVISAGAPLLILNIVFSFFLRNDNNEVIAARGFIIGNITDLSLNIILVLIFNLGTAGAAASTVIGSAVAIACYMPAIVGKKRNVIGISRTELDFRQTSSCFWVGFSTSVQHLFQLVFLLVVNRVMLTLGGEVYVAVFDVVYNISFLLVYLCEGTSEAAQPLVSTFAGERSEEDCRQVKRLSVAGSVLLSGTAAVLICAFAGYIARVFGISEEALPTAAYAMRIYCTGTVFIALNIILSRYCQSREDGKSAFVGVLLKNLLVAVPCVIYFSALGSKWIWLAFPVSEAVSFTFFLLYYSIAQKKKTQFDESRICRITLSGNDAEISALLDSSEEFCEEWSADPSQKYYVTLVIEEIVASIVRNALGHSSDGKIRVTLIAESNGDFTLHILDNAIEYNPLSRRVRGKTNRTDFDIDDVSVLLIKKKTKKYLYRQFTGFNSLTVRI